MHVLAVGAKRARLRADALDLVVGEHEPDTARHRLAGLGRVPSVPRGRRGAGGKAARGAAAGGLAEETGTPSRRWEQSGNGRRTRETHPNRLYTFLARDAVQTSPPHTEGSEVIEIEYATLAE